MNPFYSILKQFNKDDLIAVKLGIDTPEIKVLLAKELLEDDSMSKLVNHFYLEHHAQMDEMHLV